MATVGWWAETFASVTARLQKLNAAFGGGNTNAANVVLTLKKTTAALSGVMQPEGTLAGSAKKLTAALTGTHSQSGTIAVALPDNLAAAFNGEEIEQGTIGATLDTPASFAGVGDLSQTAALSGQLKQLTAAAVGRQQQTGVVTATGKQLVAALSGQEIEQGAITAALPLPPAAALAGLQTQGGTAGATLFKPSTALVGLEQPEGVLAAVQKQLAAAAAGNQTQTGVLSAALKTATAALAGSLESEQGPMATTLKQLTAALTGDHSQAGGLAGALIKAAAALSGTSLASAPSIAGTPVAVAGTSVTIPAHAVGQMIGIYAFNATSTAAPGKPAAASTVPAWNLQPGATGANTCASAVSWFVATATNHTSGTWTNTTHMIAFVVDGADPVWPLGAFVESGATSANGATAPAVNQTDANGNARLVHLFGRRATTSFTAWSAVPAGYTQQVAGVASTIGVAMDTKDDSSSDGAVTNAGNGSSTQGYRGLSLEVLSPYSTAVMFDSVGPVTGTVGTGNTLSGGTHTTKAANTKIIIAVQTRQNSTIAITVDGNAATAITSAKQAANNVAANGHLWLFEYNAASAGAHTIAGTQTSSTEDWGIVSVAYRNVTTAAWVASTYGTGSAESQAATRSTANMIVAFIGIMNDTIAIALSPTASTAGVGAIIRAATTGSGQSQVAVQESRADATFAASSGGAAWAAMYLRLS